MKTFWRIIDSRIVGMTVAIIILLVGIGAATSTLVAVGGFIEDVRTISKNIRMEKPVGTKACR